MLLVCMCAAVTQPLRPGRLVKSQKIALCYKVALLYGQPLIIVSILLQMLHAKKPQHKHTLGTDREASLTRHCARTCLLPCRAQCMKYRDMSHSHFLPYSHPLEVKESR